jgi:hypothetical protein
LLKQHHGGAQPYAPLLLFLLALSAACSEKTHDTAAPQPGRELFTRMPSGYTGVTFANRLRETHAFNVSPTALS